MTPDTLGRPGRPGLTGLRRLGVLLLLTGVLAVHAFGVGSHLAMAMAAPTGRLPAASATTALRPLTGPAFDRQFPTRRTAHQSSAVRMARTGIEQGSNLQAGDPAASTVTAQQRETAGMAGLLTSA